MTEVLAGVTLSVNAFEFWRPRGPSRLARLVKDLTCAALHRIQAYVERIFSACGYCSILDDEELFSGVSIEMSVCLKLRECWKKRLDYGNRLLMLMIQA